MKYHDSRAVKMQVAKAAHHCLSPDTVHQLSGGDAATGKLKQKCSIFLLSVTALFSNSSYIISILILLCTEKHCAKIITI